jgi:hypothetical protein
VIHLLYTGTDKSFLNRTPIAQVQEIRVKTNKKKLPSTDSAHQRKQMPEQRHRARSMAQGAECLRRKHRALSSNPSTTKKEN